MAALRSTREGSEVGLPRDAVYGPRDMKVDYATDLAEPGEYPYTRGTRPAEAARAPSALIVRELSGEGGAARSNEQFLHLLEHGATGLDVIGDGPTTALLDPDARIARHAVGNTGVSLCRAADFIRLYRDIPLNGVSVSHSMPPAFAVAGLEIAAVHHGFDPALLRGSTIMAPLFAEDTAYSALTPHRLMMRMAVDSIVHCAERMPRFHPFVEDTYFISDGSVDGVDEMALGFVEIRDVVRRTLQRGIPIDAFAPRIALLVNCRMDLFEEVAKIRASRRIYARMMREEFGARDPRSLAINVTAHTSGASMTSKQLPNNIVRGALQTAALYMAGVRAMEISSFDEPIRTPSPEAHVIALRTQQIVSLESRLGEVADPLGGSWYVESLTVDIERRILDRVAEVEALGDPLELAEQGYFRGVFAEAMVERSREINDGRRPVVGVNVHEMPDEQDTLLREIAEARIDPSYEVIDEVARWKERRDLARVVDALDRLEAAGRDERANLVEAIRVAMTADATIGESAGVLRQAVGAPYDPLGYEERPAL